MPSRTRWKRTRTARRLAPGPQMEVPTGQCFTHNTPPSSRRTGRVHSPGAALRGQTRALATARTTSLCEMTPSSSPSFSTKSRCTFA